MKKKTYFLEDQKIRNLENFRKTGITANYCIGKVDNVETYKSCVHVNLEPISPLRQKKNNNKKNQKTKTNKKQPNKQTQRTEFKRW